MFNKNELILDRVRSLTAHDLETKKMILRLTSLEEPTLACTAEGEEVVDAIGAVITTLYRAKRATFSATNSLISLDLAAMQYGTQKVVATDAAKIVDSTYEILPIVIPKEISPDIVTVKQKGEVALGSKNVEDLIEDNVKIMEDGHVVGTLKYVEEFTEFDASHVEKQSGHYFPLHITQAGTTLKTYNKTTQNRKEMEFDHDLILLVKEDSVFEISVDDKVIVTLDFTSATLAQKALSSAAAVGKVSPDANFVQLSHKPLKPENIKYIYSIVDGEVGTAYTAAATVSSTEFVIDENGKIAVPTDLTGKVFVEYQYETENAVQVTNYASKFPEAVSLIIYAYFRDKCNENLIYSGKIICPKAKINPESIELSLTSTGKHPFEFTMMKDYCADEGEDELFSIIVTP